LWCEYRACRCHRSLLGSAEYEKLSRRFATAFALTKMIDANRRQNSSR
jgi:hypothetical protein